MEIMLHLTLVWTCVYLAEIAAVKTKMTPVLYFLFFGSLFSNLGLFPHESADVVRGFAEVGILLIMFALGFEESSSHFVKSLKKSWGIAFFGALAPFMVAYYMTLFFWNDFNIALMCGLAMTATAVSLTMVSLKTEKLNHTRAATGIMTSAVLDDVASLALVAICVPIATGQAELNLLDISFTVLKSMGFFLIIVLLGIWIFPHDKQAWFSRIPIIGKLGIKHVLAFGQGQHATLTLLLLAVVTGLLSHKFGFHPAIGAYMAGLILREEYFHFHQHPDINYYKNCKQVIDSVAFSWIGPIFFVVLGTQLIFEWSIFLKIIPYTLALAGGIFIAQVLSASLAARFTGRFEWDESILIGFGMLGRAELAIVVMDIAYNQFTILTKEAFYTLMFTAFWLNISVPVTIFIWKKYIRKEIEFDV